MLYLISDTHFYHKNIIKYCDRPEDYAAIILNEWNSTVKPGDDVLHLGDFAIGWDREFPTKRDSYTDIMKQLNGSKYITLGNHDRESRTFYENIGFSQVMSHTIIDIEEFETKKVLFNHYPLEIDDEYMKPQLIEHIKNLKTLEFDYVVHGHTHRRIVGTPITKFVGVVDGILHFNCSVEVLGYRPISVVDIMQEFRVAEMLLNQNKNI